MTAVSGRFDGITGSAIRKILVLLNEPGMISFGGGNPSPRTFPEEQLAAIASSLVGPEHGDSVLQYGATKGVPAFLDYLREMNQGLMKENDDLITLSGSSQGIDFCARTYLDRGDFVLTEGPTFLGAVQTFRLCGGQVRSVPLSDDGVSLDALAELIDEFHPKFFYTIPTFQNPSGITTNAEKRAAVYDICSRADVMVLEDDPYGELRFEGQHLAPIKSHDDGHHVIRLSSFSKTISPGLRVGCAVGPKEAIRCFELLKQGADVHTANVAQCMVLEYLRSGEYASHVAAACETYRRQRDAMLGALERCAPKGVTWTRPEGGLFIWVTLPEGTDADKVFELAVSRKVAFVPGSPFYPEGGHTNTLRLNFSMPSVEQIEKGIPVLCEAVSEVMGQ